MPAESSQTLEILLTELEQLSAQIAQSLQASTADTLDTEPLLEQLTSRETLLTRLAQALQKQVESVLPKPLAVRLQQLQSQDQALLYLVQRHCNSLEQQKQALNRFFNATSTYLEPDCQEKTSFYFEQQG